MWPVILDLGFVKVYAFGTFLVIAFLVASTYVRRRAFRDLELDRERTFNICFALLFIALGGARLLYAMIHYEDFVKRPMSFLWVWEGGLVFYGGLIACVLWLAWYLPRHAELKGTAFLDVLALGTCLAIFVGRWASFLSGENYGDPAPAGLPFPLAVTFPLDPNSQARPQGEPLYATQVWHSLHGLLLFLALRAYAARRPHPGRLTGLFLVLYAVGRFFIEFYRGDDQARGMVIDGALSISQVISIPVFFAGLALYLVRRPPSVPAAHA